MPDARVLAHDDELFVGEATGFEQDVVGGADLADVVHRGGGEEALAQFVVEPQAAGDETRVVGHAQDVGPGFGVAELGGAGEAGNGFLFAGDDLGGLADHGVAQVVVPGAQALVAGAQGEHGAHARVELVAIDRLGEEVVGAGGEALVAHFFLVGGRHHEDRHGVGGVVLAHRLDEFDAVEVGHHVIDDDQVGFVVATPLQAFDGRGEGDDLGAGRGQLADQGLDQGEVERCVVDDGNGHEYSRSAGAEEGRQRQIIGPQSSKLSGVAGELAVGAGATRGRVRTNRVPAPGTLWTTMRPPST